MERSRAIQACFPIFFFALVFFLVIYFVGFGGCKQSRGWSRLTGEPLELVLPDDFERPISFTSGREGEKDLFYEATDGTYKVKTYTDSGYLESEIEFVSQDK